MLPCSAFAFVAISSKSFHLLISLVISLTALSLLTEPLVIRFDGKDVTKSKDITKMVCYKGVFMNKHQIHPKKEFTSI